MGTSSPTLFPQLCEVSKMYLNTYLVKGSASIASSVLAVLSPAEDASHAPKVRQVEDPHFVAEEAVSVGDSRTSLLAYILPLNLIS